MSGAPAVRALAARIVAQVIRDGHSLDRVLDAEAPADPGQRPLLRALCFGTVRWCIRLRALLKRLLTRGAQPLEPQIEGLLLVGLYQLVDTAIAVHAVVSETVEASRALGRPRAAGLVNAVLRRAQREAQALLADIDRDLALRTSHPQWLVERLASDWGPDLEPLLDANNLHPPLWLRVNLRRTDVTSCQERLLAAGHVSFRSVCAPEALRLEQPIDVRGLNEFEEGRVSVQDAAAQLAAHLLDGAPGQRVLDACAAPGGKTCHLLELQPELGELVAVDLSRERLARIAQNLQRLGLAATLLAGDAAQPASWWDGAPFERILLDVPCSGTGVIRRHPDIKLLRRASDIGPLVDRQQELLRALWPLLAPGGRLLYASCSALRAENSDVVREFLGRNADASDVTPEIAAGRPAAPGLSIRAGAAEMDGFYYACLEKLRG